MFAEFNRLGRHTLWISSEADSLLACLTVFPWWTSHENLVGQVSAFTIIPVPWFLFYSDHVTAYALNSKVIDPTLCFITHLKMAVCSCLQWNRRLGLFLVFSSVVVNIWNAEHHTIAVMFNYLSSPSIIVIFFKISVTWIQCLMNERIHWWEESRLQSADFNLQELYFATAHG